MEVTSQLREELKEVLDRRKQLAEELRNMDYFISVFQKELSLRNN